MKASLFEEFKSIVHQEYYLDQYRWQIESSCYERKHYFLYRFYRKSYYSILKFLYPLIVFFIPIFVPIIAIGYLAKMLFSKAKIKIRRNPIKKGSYLLNFSVQALTRYPSLNLNKEVQIISPYRLKTQNSISPEEVLSFRQLFYNALEVFYISLRFPFYFSPRYYVYLLFLPTLLQAYHLLESFPSGSEVYFCNHYDRWALLFGKRKHLIKNLFQHGVVSSNVKVFEKIPDIDRLYYLDSESRDIFEKFFLKDKPKEAILYEHKIELTPMGEGEIKILVINQPNTIHQDVELCNYLVDTLLQYNVDIFLKKHPLVKESLSKLDSRVRVCLKEFPVVDLAVAQVSTLGAEYEKCGVQVIWTQNRTQEEVKKKILSWVDEFSS